MQRTAAEILNTLGISGRSGSYALKEILAIIGKKDGDDRMSEAIEDGMDALEDLHQMDTVADLKIRIHRDRWEED